MSSRRVRDDHEPSAAAVARTSISGFPVLSISKAKTNLSPDKWVELGTPRPSENLLNRGHELLDTITEDFETFRRRYNSVSFSRCTLPDGPFGNWATSRRYRGDL